MSAELGLHRLLDPEIQADPYPLYHRLRSEEPVRWDPYLNAWVVTRYADVVRVFTEFSARRTPAPEQLTAWGMGSLAPVAQVMVRQMLFLDPPQHGRVRTIAAKALTPRRVQSLREHIQDIIDDLIDAAFARGRLDIIADLANPLPAIVTAELLGVPTADWRQLTEWSGAFSEMLGNFQHNPEHGPRMLRTVEELTAYFAAAIAELRSRPRDGLIHAFMTAEHDGDRLTEEEVIANCIITIIGGQETTTNLIGTGLYTLLRHPDALRELRVDASLIPSAIEELLRYESPTQHTGRLAPDDVLLGDKPIRKRTAVIAVMGAANRDPERFPDPDRFDIHRVNNRHVAFGWAGHYCFGAPLARMEGQLAFETLLRRMARIELEDGFTPRWQPNLCFRGLTSLPIRFDAREIKVAGG